MTCGSVVKLYNSYYKVGLCVLGGLLQGGQNMDINMPSRLPLHEDNNLSQVSHTLYLSSFTGASYVHGGTRGIEASFLKVGLYTFRCSLNKNLPS